MSRGELSAAPAGDVAWTYRHREWDMVVGHDGVARPGTGTVRARSWFAARELAAAELRVSRDALLVVRAQTDEVAP